MREFILDVNVDVEPSQAEYPRYFFDDLRRGSGIKIIVGGNSYKSELKKQKKLLALIDQLISAGRVRSVRDSDVDKYEVFLRSKLSDFPGGCPGECDDHHIFALSKISSCVNIITKEKRMATCRDKIRNLLGHDICPAIRVIRTEAAYRDS